MWQFDTKTKTFTPGMLPADGSQITACYDRLSQEDELEGDSNSILNQRDFLLKYGTDNNHRNLRFFSDDGFTGTNFDRPGFKEMMELVEQGMVKTIIVKDHSRLGRNRLVVGALMECFTEDYGVRYIAVTDGIDSDRGLDDMVAVRELFNEFFPRDTSKKIRAVLNSKGNSGQRLCTQVPYGYVGNKYNWEIDPEAAAVIREVFALCISGLGPMQIAKRMTAQQILTPVAYHISQGKQVTHSAPIEPCKWNTNSVVKILERKEYTGCTVNFKTRKKSYKSKKTIYLAPDERKEFPDTHPAIIDAETWNRVQELRKNKRRPTKTGKQSLFSGLLYCADCGEKLYYCTCITYKDETQDHFVCSNYKSNTGTCSAHFIREVVLSDLVLEHLRQTLYYVRNYEADFIKAIADKSQEEQLKELRQKQKELAQAEKRIAELDVLFQRIYEDSLTGKLTEERFSKLSTSYEAEQKELVDRVAILQDELEQGQRQAVNVGSFLALVQRYTEVQELTATIVNEFIDRIVIYAPDKSSGHRKQRVDIHYNFVGMLPDLQAQSKTA